MMKYLYEVFENMPRCGPGDNESTRRAYSFLSDLPEHPRILDIGCGSGMQTLELARISNGRITALDNHQAFLDILMQKAEKEGLNDRIIPKNQSMTEMDFENNTFDIIWSEGALYFMGFENGLKRCYELLKEEGYLAVTEAVYLQRDLPLELTEFWNAEYPDIGDIETKIEQVIMAGFILTANFTLPKSAWLENYYIPMEEVVASLRQKYLGDTEVHEVFDHFQREIDFYKKYSDYYGYEFFVARKE